MYWGAGGEGGREFLVVGGAAWPTGPRRAPGLGYACLCRCRFARSRSGFGLPAGARGSDGQAPQVAGVCGLQEDGWRAVSQAGGGRGRGRTRLNTREGSGAHVKCNHSARHVGYPGSNRALRSPDPFVGKDRCPAWVCAGWYRLALPEPLVHPEPLPSPATPRVNHAPGNCSSNACGSAALEERAQP